MASQSQKRKASRRVAPAAWLRNPDEQKEWTASFLRALKTYAHSDPVISTILQNPQARETCAVKIRTYVDKGVTAWLYQERNDRKMSHKKLLKSAIEGLRAAAKLQQERDGAVAQKLGEMASGFSETLKHLTEIYETKRHGVGRSHGTLRECQIYLQEILNRHITYTTLANLVNAGLAAEGGTDADESLITEEQIRKNLSRFAVGSPAWGQALDARKRGV
jgi:hypothetical protein